MTDDVFAAWGKKLGLTDEAHALLSRPSDMIRKEVWSAWHDALRDHGWQPRRRGGYRASVSSQVASLEPKPGGRFMVPLTQTFVTGTSDLSRLDA